MATKGYDLDDVPVGGGREKAPRVEEIVDLLELTPSFQQIRIVGAMFPYGVHWVATKRRDGSSTKFPVACSAFDSETGQRDSTKECPWCKHMEQHPEPRDAKERKGFVGVSFGVDYYVNVILRKLQKKIRTPEEPTAKEAKLGFKLKDSDTPTIYKVIRLTGGIIRTIKGLKELNVHEVDGESQAFPVSHPKYGADISIRFDADAAGAAKYPVQLGQACPVKRAEKEFLQWDISSLVPVPDIATQKSEYASWAERMGFKVKAANKKSSKVEEEEDDDDSEGSGLDDDDDDVPSAKKKTKKPVRRQHDDDDDGDDEEPAPKKSSKSRKSDDDDDDDDVPSSKTKAKSRRNYDEDDDEQDDGVVSKSAKSRAASKKSVDEDEDEDDDDDIPPPRSKKKGPNPFEEEPTSKKARKPSRRQADDEDDDDDLAY